MFAWWGRSRVRVQTSDRGQALRWGLPLLTLAGLGLGAVPLAARLAPVLTPAEKFEGELLLLFFLAWLAWPGAGALAIISARLLLVGQRPAVVPLLAASGALAIPFLPLASAARDLDDTLHRTARTEIVRRIEAGELGPFVHVPPGADPTAPTPREGLVALIDYPWAVSNCGGHRLADVRLEGDRLRVTFCPHGGWRNGGWWIVYDAADWMPELSDPRLRGWGFERVERLRARWYRLSRD